MVWVPQRAGYNLIIESHTGRPAAAFGATVTPGNNTYGSYATVLSGASVTADVFGIIININSGATAAAARDMIVTIGLDPAGGTSFTDTINHLLCSGSGGVGVLDSGVWYYFPLFIKSGSTIGAKASVNNATVGSCRVWCKLLCKPFDESSVIIGQKVTTYGVSTGTSTGTAVTPGTTGEGTWTSLGTTSDDHFYWEVGMGMNDGNANNGIIFADLSVGNASNKKIIMSPAIFNTNSSEATTKQLQFPCFMPTKSGDIVYGRLQHSGTVDTVSMAAYAMSY